MIKMILKGMVIGVANIIPGVSGGTMAVSMGIYDKIIHAATHIVSEFKESMRLLVPVLAGAALGIVALARVIEAMFDRIPFQTNLLFIGLILGGLPAVVKKVRGKGVKAGYLLPFLIFFAAVVWLAAISGGEGADVDLGFSLANVCKLCGIGVIASATMVIPGVSGSMVLMLMGYYNPILEEVNRFIDNMIRLDLSGMAEGYAVLVPFGIGVVVGIIAIAKAIEFLFQKFPEHAYWAIIGLIAASPVAILLMNRSSFEGIGALTAGTGALAAAAGVLISLKLGEE